MKDDPDFNIDFVGVIEEYPCIYDHSISDHSNRNVIDNAWEKIAKRVSEPDYTLWPFWVDTHVNPPFHKNSAGKVVDYRGCVIKHYPDIPKVLKYLQDKNIAISVASRTGETDGAEQLIQLFGWNKYFQNKQIYPGSKDTHINKISKKCNIKLEDMIFFDDEQRNIVDLKHLGVVSILVKNGMTMQVLMNGLKKFSDIRSNV